MINRSRTKSLCEDYKIKKVIEDDLLQIVTTQAIWYFNSRLELDKKEDIKIETWVSFKCNNKPSNSINFASTIHILLG